MSIPVDFRWRVDFWNWCVKHGVIPEYQGTLAGKDLWCIHHDKILLLALLRWS